MAIGHHGKVTHESCACGNCKHHADVQKGSRLHYRSTSEHDTRKATVEAVCILGPMKNRGTAYAIRAVIAHSGHLDATSRLAFAWFSVRSIPMRACIMKSRSWAASIDLTGRRRLLPS